MKATNDYLSHRHVDRAWSHLVVGKALASPTPDRSYRSGSLRDSRDRHRLEFIWNSTWRQHSAHQVVKFGTVV